MVKVNVKFSALIKEIIDTNEATIEIDGDKVGELLAALIHKYGTQFRKWIMDESTGKPRRFINIFVNGRDIRNLQGLDTKLTEGDEIRLIPTVAGGKYHGRIVLEDSARGCPFEVKEKTFSHPNGALSTG
ncbi:MAG: MoaD family protein [Hadesarchaea archaeon]|nr:MoaD family protein [Hadesarchaea archaeon]